jgi:pimeloyl-ACP methyl ester carboxylesterase
MHATGPADILALEDGLNVAERYAHCTGREPELADHAVRCDDRLLMPDLKWLDRSAYPFEPRYLQVPGGRMHYVDKGRGEPILMVHGTPTWSFVYRHLIRELSRDYRVVAVDHLGFGLSDKPENGTYRPQQLASNLRTVIDQLELRRFALVVHDFGGPIGLSYAIDEPANVRALVLFNTWMWSLRKTSSERLSRLLSGRLGRWLYTRANFSPKVLLRTAYGDKRKLTPEVHRHYIKAFSRPGERMAPWVFARELMASSDWYEYLWNQRERIAGLPALLLWGMKDPAFTPEALERWQHAFRNAKVVRFPAAGHFVQEEAPAEAAEAIRDFLRPL